MNDLMEERVFEVSRSYWLTTILARRRRSVVLVPAKG